MPSGGRFVSRCLCASGQLFHLEVKPGSDSCGCHLLHNAVFYDDHLCTLGRLSGKEGEGGLLMLVNTNQEKSLVV